MHRMGPITGKVGKIGWFTDNPKFAARPKRLKCWKMLALISDANPAKVPGLVDFWHIAAQNPLARVYGKALEANGLRHGLPSLIASDVRIVDAETGTRRQIDYVFDVGGVRVHSDLTTLTQKTLDDHFSRESLQGNIIIFTHPGPPKGWP